MLGLKPRCVHCSKSFKNSTSRSNHYRRYHPDEHKVFRWKHMVPNHQCDWCLAWYGTRGSLRNHRMACLHRPSSKGPPRPRTPGKVTLPVTSSSLDTRETTAEHVPCDMKSRGEKLVTHLLTSAALMGDFIASLENPPFKH